MTDQPHPLVGKFVLYDDGGGRRTGKVVEAITPEMVLVQFDHMSREGHVMPMEVVDIAEMAGAMQDGELEIRRWGFFNSAEEREKFLNPPSSGSVVRLVKKDDR